jgi:hypothetical protein
MYRRALARREFASCEAPAAWRAWMCGEALGQMRFAMRAVATEEMTNSCGGGQNSRMATRTTVTFEDDLDGGKAEETVRFGLDGRAYELDLSGKNAAKLRKTLAAYMAAGRRVGRVSAGAATRTVGQSPDSTEDSAAVRQWARDNGYEVGDRGRISVIVLAAYKSAN